MRRDGNSTDAPPLPHKVELAVRSIPFADSAAFAGLEQYAGQLPMSDTDHMFFWLIANTTNAHNHDKLVIWLNGGPGCSSLDGVFMENGPYKFAGSSRLVARDYSLAEQFDVLYIDQPFGTGFSVAPTDSFERSFKHAAQTLAEFLARFYRVFPEYRERQLYVAGESEAGTYIPYLADAILKLPEAERIDLRGLMIGNGWVDPYPMYMSYAELLRRRQLLTPALQTKLLAQMDRCTREFNRAPQPVHTDACEGIAGVFLDDEPAPGMCYNMYDLRLTDTQPACGMNWPPEVHMYTEYLNRKDVQVAINVGARAPAAWTECNNQVNRMLRRDTSPPASTLLPGILEHMPVLFFVGKEDYLCNYVGTEWTIGNLTWAGATGFAPGSQRNWTIDGDPVGVIAADRGLTYALISDASHMVGVDKPREILDLFTAFTNASAANLRFRSSFRSGAADEISMPVPARDGGAAGRWLALALLLALAVGFALCFVCRRRLFAWWVARRAGYGTIDGRRADDDALVAVRGRRSDDLDDAFMMSEFSFKGKRRSLDVEGLLLDDSMASSPDDDRTAMHSSGRSPEHSQ
ncbi:Cell death protease [Coemansia sp. Cherry 401B]|nr:Cell death protease [Coemansia sp. RSA 2704]KAJ2735434.1 Cell death protease [Coemansia sp. Cherry 401B]